jgi:hypothetical protein
MMNGAWLRYRDVNDSDLVETILNPEIANRDWVVQKSNEFWSIRCATAVGQVLENPGSGQDHQRQLSVFAEVTGIDNNQQEWHLIELASIDAVGGKFYVQNRDSGLFLTSTADNRVSVDAQVVEQQEFEGSLRQQWLFEKQ